MSDKLRGITISKSWYQYNLSNATQNAKNYLAFLQKSFNVADPYMQPISYDMTPYQVEIHCNSFNVLREDSKHILQIKARGISFTYTSLIELIVTGVLFDSQIIPIISQDERGGLDSLNVAKWLIKNSNLKELKEDAVFTDKSDNIFFKSTGSVIKVYPSSSAANAIRGRRLIRGLIDEFAFQQNDKKLWTAASKCMSHGIGQWLIGSTPCGRQNMFFTLVKKTRENSAELGFYLIETPIFDPKKFNQNISIFKQDLIPVAHWIPLSTLESDRLLDIITFMQENMCDFLDDSLSFISYATIMRNISDDLPNLKEVIDLDLSYKYLETDNPIYIGIDVAEKTDLFCLTAFELVEDENGVEHFIQRYLDYFNGKRIPELEEYTIKIINMFPNIVNVHVDETGLGTGLVGYLEKTFGRLIQGVQFASSIKIGKGKDKAPIRKVMITNFRRLLESGQITLINDAKQINHINSVDYSFSVPNNKGGGHSDILFADCLAVLKDKKRLIKTDNAFMKKFRRDYSKQNPIEEEQKEKEKKFKKSSLNDALARFRKNRK